MFKIWLKSGEIDGFFDDLMLRLGYEEEDFGVFGGDNDELVRGGGVGAEVCNGAWWE